MESLVGKIEKWIQPVLEEENLFLVNVEISPSYKIQVFVDTIPFINIKQCAKVSRHLEEYLDEDESVPEKYNIEVSSPGMGNALKVPLQYKKREGSVLKIITNSGESFAVKVFEAGDESFKGGITTLPEKGKKGPKNKKSEVPDEQLEKIELNYSDIKQAKLHFNF